MLPEQLPSGSYLGTLSYIDCSGNTNHVDVYSNEYFEICAQEGTVQFTGDPSYVILIGDCFY
jgi:hypothetical protein